MNNGHRLDEVTVNGKHLGLLRTPPFSVEVTAAMKAGANTLNIEVAKTFGSETPAQLSASFATIEVRGQRRKVIVARHQGPKDMP